MEVSPQMHMVLMTQLLHFFYCHCVDRIQDGIRRRKCSIRRENESGEHDLLVKDGVLAVLAHPSSPLLEDFLVQDETRLGKTKDIVGGAKIPNAYQRSKFRAFSNEDRRNTIFDAPCKSGRKRLLRHLDFFGDIR
jgi:hypothetical protein